MTRLRLYVAAAGAVPAVVWFLLLVILYLCAVQAGGVMEVLISTSLLMVLGMATFSLVFCIRFKEESYKYKHLLLFPIFLGGLAMLLVIILILSIIKTHITLGVAFILLTLILPLISSVLVIFDLIAGDNYWQRLQSWYQD